MGALSYSALKVLVIDDFDSFRLTVCNMLDEFGCEQIETAVNGRRALKACAETQFDVVLCDYNLGPGPNGQQVLETMRVQKLLARQSLFLLVSAESSKSIVLSAYDYEPNAYLTKPITGSGLKKRLDRLLIQRGEMIPIYKRLDAEDVEGAIAIAVGLIDGGSRYSAAIQKLLGELYLRTGKVSDAAQLYTKVLEVRPLDWAQVGMSRAKKAQGDLDTSNKWLTKIIQDNPFCMQAYDVLADNYRELGDMDEMQSVLESAVEVSPMAIVRQSALAQVARDNHDYLVASKAFSRTVRLGQNSCRDSLDAHLDFARTTAAMLRDNPSANTDVAREGLRVMEQLGKRFELTHEARMIAQLQECQLYASRGDMKKARDQLAEVETGLAGQRLSLDVQLDRVATFQGVGDDLKSSQLLAQLVEEYAGDQDALKRIDLWLDEPISEYNCKLVAKLNNEGISLHKKKEFTKALDCFKRAVRLFPNHLGVHLNLVQALVADMKELGRTDESMELCLTSLQKVERKIRPGNAQMERYRQLQQMVRSLG